MIVILQYVCLSDLLGSWCHVDPCNTINLAQKQDVVADVAQLNVGVGSRSGQVSGFVEDSATSCCNLIFVSVF